MTSNRFSRLLALFIILIFAMAFIPGLAQGDIGDNGGTTELVSDIEMMSGIPVHGGGHFNWKVTGAAAGELRQAIIRDYDGEVEGELLDGELSWKEVEKYALDLERYLENGEHEYMGANLRKFALLNYNVNEDTKGLVGTSANSPGNIEIRFYFDAWMPSGNEDMELTDTTILDAIYYPVSENFTGDYKIEHTEYMISIGDFSNVNIDKGSLYIIRTPFGEIFHYSVEFKASDNPDETMLYEPFNWLEAPLVLFIVMVVFGYFIVTMPGRFRRYDVLKIVKVHTLAKVLLIILILLYLFAAFGGAFIGGIYIWLISVVFLFVSLVVSKTVYENAKRITSPETESGTTPTDEELEQALEEEPGRDVQCTTCGEIFTQTNESISLPSTPCPACGNIGAVDFGQEEGGPPPTDLEPPPPEPAPEDPAPPPPPPPE
jgi:hypothetical protein